MYWTECASCGVVWEEDEWIGRDHEGPGMSEELSVLGVIEDVLEQRTDINIS